MATDPVSHAERESFLLQLLHFAGCQRRIRDGQPTRIHARRGDVELEVTGASLAEAAGITFARAMHSSNGGRRPEDD